MKINEPKSFEDMAFLIRRFFMGTDPYYNADRKKLWDVLCALRGPDNDSETTVKAATTCIIRMALFGKIPLSLAHNVFGIDGQHLTQRRVQTNNLVTGGHFILHAKAAFAALGLDWNDVNPDVEDMWKQRQQRRRKDARAERWRRKRR